MTDGPHKSLPMKPVWRKVAQRAWNSAFTPEQVAEAVPRALLRECEGDLVRHLERALAHSIQGVLFEETPQLVAARVDALRASCPGSQFGTNLLDAAIFGIYHHDPGQSIIDRALRDAMRATVDGAFRGIEEHGLRKKGPETAQRLRERLAAAGNDIDYEQLRHQVKGDAPKRSTSIPQRRGLEDGVPLR